MKKLLLLLGLAIIFSMTNCSKAATVPQEQNTEQQHAIMPYKLYPTSNMWTFIKLDTRNGKMWQVQYSIKGDDYRFESPLNMTPLVTAGDEAGRFELYPTQNIYNFILLDGMNGKTWQVQWSTEPESQGIIPIKQSGI
ncbi:MAG: hypothetical protein NC343_01420 [Muribaculum sp.]|nr:hypothetical protein [Muribaculaceae bacterium]MCM1080396.1 hypothetical protein [Muribaculum sp.]